jgi:hypothetical protein
MRRILMTTAVFLAMSGCSSGEPGPAGPSPSSTTTTTSSDAAPVSPLEGTWTTDLKRAAVKAYIRDAKWGKRAERALLDPDMAGPRDTEFRIDFVGDRFRMAQVSTDEQWQSGTFTIEQGRIVLDDEAPVGVLSFRLTLEGDTATFDEPGPDGDRFEFMPGIPGWAPGAVMWASTAWERRPD